MLAVNQLTVRVAATAQPVCTDLSVVVEPDMCVGVLGMNGAGKTTLLHSLAGLLAVQAGEVLIEGQPLAILSAKLRAQKLAILLQAHGYHFPVTVMEAALASRYAYSESVGESQQIVQAALAGWDLLEKQHQLVGTLSGGELQRLALAMTQAQASAVVLLDEPVNNLDLRYHAKVVETFAKGTGKATVAVLHDVALVKKMCSHVLLLKAGQWRFGSVAEYCQPEHLAWVYEMTEFSAEMI